MTCHLSENQQKEMTRETPKLKSLGNDKRDTENKVADTLYNVGSQEGRSILTAVQLSRIKVTANLQCKTVPGDRKPTTVTLNITQTLPYH